MLKIKLCLISAAIICSIIGAFAGKPTALCTTQPQFFKFGNSYLPAGDYGVDYVCTGSAGICTYYQPNPFDPNSYAPCRTGSFTWLFKSSAHK
jgi:hypothetical protein